MLTLFSYPGLYNLADNNPYGLKTYAFLKLNHLPFHHQHIFDAARAPRAQLPYLLDGNQTIGDSDTIIAHLTASHALTIDQHLTQTQRDTALLIGKLLDDLYWVMSYSRWKDPEFWPAFQDAILRTHPSVTAESLTAAQTYNFQRYHYQGIGRYQPAEVYARGTANLTTLANLLPPTGCMFGPAPTSTDAAIYGFIANIYNYDIPTPLKTCVLSRPNLVSHCQSIHAAVATPN